MCFRYLDGHTFLKALRETAEQLSLNREKLNRINVFPVPDGDTGNNLLHTLESALTSAEQAAGSRLGPVVEAASRGARDGSRGSSGAIFAQFLEGWAGVLDRVDRARANHLARAMQEGTLKAYAAVVRPVEGTILTVARKAAEAARQVSPGGDLAETMRAVYRQAEAALGQTPRMLEALGKRGVVDAGGWGLLLFFRSLLKAMRVQDADLPLDFEPEIIFEIKPAPFEFEHPYDMEFYLSHPGSGELEASIRGALQAKGSELITGPGQGGCRVHIHSDRPLAVMEKAAALGTLKEIIIRDMRAQHREQAAGGGREHPALIAVGESPGFLALFALAGASVAAGCDVPGIATRVAGEFPAGAAVVLSASPITMANPGQPLLIVEEEARVLSALLSANLNGPVSPESLREAAAYPRVASIDVSGDDYRVRVGGREQGGGAFSRVIDGALSSLDPHPGELLSIYYGRTIEPALAGQAVLLIQERFPYLELETYFGGQEHPLILSIE